jgi:hypothetical protein
MEPESDVYLNCTKISPLHGALNAESSRFNHRDDQFVYDRLIGLPIVLTAVFNLRLRARHLPTSVLHTTNGWLASDHEVANIPSHESSLAIHVSD